MSRVCTKKTNKNKQYTTDKMRCRAGYRGKVTMDERITDRLATERVPNSRVCPAKTIDLRTKGWKDLGVIDKSFTIRTLFSPEFNKSCESAAKKKVERAENSIPDIDELQEKGWTDEDIYLALIPKGVYKDVRASRYSAIVPVKNMDKTELRIYKKFAKVLPEEGKGGPFENERVPETRKKKR